MACPPTYETAELVRALLAGSPHAAYLVDLTGKVVFANRRGAERLGKTEQDIVGTSLADYFPPDAAEARRQRGIEVLLSGQEATFEDRIGERWYLSTVSPLRDEQGRSTHLAVYGVDITERKQMEESLRQSQRLYRVVTDSVADVVWVLELQSGRFRYVSPSVERLVGYTPEETLQLSPDQLLSARSKSLLLPEVLERRVEAFLAGDPAAVTHVDETEQVRKDGSLVWVEISTTLLQNEQGGLEIIGVSRDVTQRRMAEELLRTQRDLALAVSGTRELAETLRLCLEAAMRATGMDCGGIYLLNLAADAFDLAHHHGLPAEFVANASRYPSDSPNARLVKAGRPLYTRYAELVPPDDATQREGLRALAVLPILHKGKVIGCLNLASHTVDEFPEVSRAAAETTATQIGVAIARSRAEEELRRSEATYRTLFEEASDGIVLVDIESGTIADCNRAVQDLVGRERSEVVGSPLGILHPPRSAPPLAHFLDQKAPRVTETQVLTKTEEQREVAVKGNRVSLGDREVLQALYRDITEAKRLEAQLRQAQKMEAIGTLAGGIAHDFNNLLMGIQGNASLLQLELEQPQHERIKSIEDCVRSGTELTAQLLGFARGGRYEVRPLDLNALVHGTSSMFGRTRREISIHRKLQDGLWAVEADRGQIEQVLVNLLVNAWQAMPGGGELYLETSNLTLEQAEIAAFDVPAGRYVRVSVTDTGVGMDEETRQRIFEPFFTTKEMGRGTGLGLATVYGIVRSHGGFVSVYSEKGAGSTFNIFLPASDRPVAAARPRSGAVVSGTETVLFVDDEETVLAVSCKMMERLGYQVLVARNGAEALEQYRRHQDRIAMVILDLIMPGMGGGEIYDRLRQVDPGVRVLLSSGYSLNGEARAIVERGCRGFIQKPFNLKDLSQRMRDVLDGD